jgi:hypothetical protein
MERSPEGKQEPRRTDDTVEQRQIKAKKRYRIKQTGYLFLVALAVITAIGGLSAASAYVDNFSVTALKDIFAIVGGPLAIAYFVFRVGYQKQYQRLSSDVAVTVLGPCDGKLLVEIACIITNEAECRINFSFATFQVYDGTKDYPSAHDSLLCNDKFPTNLYWVEPRDKETIPFKLSFAALGDESGGGDVRRVTATFG